MHIDTFLPGYDVEERHETLVRASASEAYRAVREIDLARSLPILALFLIRGIAHLLTRKARLSRTLTLDYLLEAGFVLLAEEPGAELVLGVVGKFWRLDSGIRPIEPAEFMSFDEPGYCKAVLNFTVREERDGRCRLATETRIAATDEAARGKFRRYWRVIGPFSGQIRRWMLGLIRRDAEARARRASEAPERTL